MPDRPFCCRLSCPQGDLLAVSSAVGLRSLRFLDSDGAPAARGRAGEGADLLPGDPHGLVPAFNAYLNGQLDAFVGLPLDVGGTPFQQQVWALLRALPAGRTTTYGALAADLGQREKAQAVGAAVGRNPVAIVIPCHRVIGADGGMVGFAWGLARKRWLLEHEGAVAPDRQVALFG